MNQTIRILFFQSIFLLQIAAGLTVEIKGPAEGLINEGETLVLRAEVSGAVGNLDGQWETPAGAVRVGQTQLVFPLISPTESGTYKLTLTDANSSPVSAEFGVNVVPRASGTTLPSTAVVPRDSTVTLRGPGPESITRSWSWFFNDHPLPDFGLGNNSFSGVSFDKAGRYELVEFDPTEVRYAIELKIAESRLTNLSARARFGAENGAMTLGFVTTGQPFRHLPGSRLLARVVGPTLSDFGIRAPATDPTLAVFKPRGETADPLLLATNDNWEAPDGVEASELAEEVGAFPLPTNSTDAATVLTQSAGQISTMEGRSNSNPGIALAEIYTAQDALVTLSNTSIRATVDSDEATLIAGFTIAGDWPLRLLIRGVGPGLAEFGVDSSLPNPKLVLYDSDGTPIHNNDTWSEATNADEIAESGSRFGAFALIPTSNDAAILETLPPGTYTVHLTSVDGQPGNALIEVYTIRPTL